MLHSKRWVARPGESATLLMTLIIGVLGFLLVAAAENLRAGRPFTPELLPQLIPALLPPLVLGISLLGLHFVLIWRGSEIEQVLLPAVALLFTLGLIMIWRLRGADGAWQQITRGWLPGALLVGVLLARPRWMEAIRRSAVWISAGGLFLTALTAVFGVVDETGARLALKLGPLPAIQTSEILKVSLIIFLAWYIDREGAAAEGRAITLFGRLRLPAVRYFMPGALFVGMASLALVRMSDFGAVLILGLLFVAMLYAGFETRTFLTVAAIGAGFAVLAGLVLAGTWELPSTIQNRYLAFMNPWSSAPLLINGQPTGLTIAEGPGYQIQQAIYAMIAGGVTGSGLGLGYPQFIPLSHSDFIYAAVLEEMGGAIGLAILALYGIVLLRIFRIAVLLPHNQLFERLLLTGIGVHFFAQVLVMVGGTLNLMPLTGVTLPFLANGGMAVLVNLLEVGLALALAHRLEVRPA
jgi:cell division protein FtsW (lipid II flippase)